MEFNINVNVRFLNGPSSSLSQEDRQWLEKQFMGLKEDFDASIAQINTATNNLSQRVTDLAGKLKNSMTDDEVAAFKQELSGISTNLDGIAADPSNVVPEPTPGT